MSNHSGRVGCASTLNSLNVAHDRIKTYLFWSPLSEVINNYIVEM